MNAPLRRPSAPGRRPLRSERGSLLIVAMLLCAVIAISLVSYLQLGRTALTLSNRALYNNAAMNLAERGLEESLYSINEKIADPDYSWHSDGWTISGANAYRKWTGTALSQNTTAEYRAYVYNYAGVSTPVVVAKATVTLGGGHSTDLDKWVRVTLSRASKFANGLVAKQSIVFNGNNAAVDSWNSDPDNNPATAAIPYSSSVRADRGSVGSISVSVDSVLVKQADIWGYVSTGGDDPVNTVGHNGSILGADSVYDAATWSSSNVDPARTSTQFTASFDPVSAPAVSYLSLGSITSSTDLPQAGDTPAADGHYYYTASSVSLASSRHLNITSGKVVLKLTDTSTSFSLSGQATLGIATGASLVIYAEGTIDLTGNGVANGSTGGTVTNSTANQPINLQVYGTKASGSQTIKIAGNGTLSATVYAPNGDVSIHGNGDVAGSIVANNITVTGNASFHYDESLGNLGTGNPFRISKWEELTTKAARDAYTAAMNF